MAYIKTTYSLYDVMENDGLIVDRQGNRFTGVVEQYSETFYKTGKPERIFTFYKKGKKKEEVRAVGRYVISGYQYAADGKKTPMTDAKLSEWDRRLLSVDMY